MKLKRTDLINELLSENSPGLESIEPSSIGELWIEHTSAIRLGKACGVPLFNLFKGTEVYITPRPPRPPKSPEYLEFINELRKNEEERQYRAIADGALSKDPSSMNFQSVSKEVNEQLTTIFNILVSIVAVGWAFWYWCSSWSLGARTLMSLFAGIITGVAEVVVYTGYLRRVEAAKSRQPAHKEVRKVTKEFVFHKGKEVSTAESVGSSKDLKNRDLSNKELKNTSSDGQTDEKAMRVRYRGLAPDN